MNLASVNVPAQLVSAMLLAQSLSRPSAGAVVQHVLLQIAEVKPFKNEDLYRTRPWTVALEGNDDLVDSLTIGTLLAMYEVKPTFCNYSLWIVCRLDKLASVQHMLEQRYRHLCSPLA